MSRTGGQSQTPRAVIHKRILEVAGSEPGASMEEIASSIGGASTDLVERVLDEYGDPGEAEGDPGGVPERADRGAPAGQAGREGVDRHGGVDEPAGVETGEREDENGGSTPKGNGTDQNTSMKDNGRSDGAYADLSDEQLRALRLVERNPDASQGEIAEEFDVTRATISRWLSDVPGFEWSRRDELAARILNGGGIEEGRDPTAPEEAEAEEAGAETREPEPSAEGVSERLEELGRRFERIERRLDRLETGAGTEVNPGTETNTGTEPGTAEARGVAGIAPELAHKVVHACLNSDRISEEEELQVLKELMD